ncbi:leucyl/phenylalanyl-tRNA--protein transferase [Leptobacterium sp. I13]|uniref:leucyl/phenylalanyl-tRNA--protein transferase n=1 Tax=Leptobacterium meishanense TaxID=3128904 RepID=UPI0030ED6500
MYHLTEEIKFPSIKNATKEGIIAIGGNLSVKRLLLAYRTGIFPWYEEGTPIIWWSPDPRMVLFPNKLKISKSMQQIMRNNTFQVTYNEAFKDVITHCAHVKRKDQKGTWITKDMITAYCKLHEAGHATSVEVWKESELIGGLYGVDLGHIFCGESMFSIINNASKVAFIHLVQRLYSENYKLIDCQVYTKHLASLGAEEIPRADFLKLLSK